jgi:hypothetical protein
MGYRVRRCLPHRWMDGWMAILFDRIYARYVDEKTKLLIVVNVVRARLG